MAMKIRLARGGSKKRPFYRIVAADSRMPRDGRFIEKLGTYSPLRPKDSDERLKMNLERIRFWLDRGARPTDRVARFLEAAGVIERKQRNNPKKGEPGQKARDRAKEKAEKPAAGTAGAVETVETVGAGAEARGDEAVETVETAGAAETGAAETDTDVETGGGDAAKADEADETKGDETVPAAEDAASVPKDVQEEN